MISIPLSNHVFPYSREEAHSILEQMKDIGITVIDWQVSYTGIPGKFTEYSLQVETPYEEDEFLYRMSQ